MKFRNYRKRFRASQMGSRTRHLGGIKSVPFSKLVPNIVTLFGLVVGVSSIRFALDSKWELSVTCILAAAIIDALDGGLARLLDASSHFGAELDSLCDLVNFGVCPALLIYLWSFQQYEFRVLSWSINLLFIVCMAIRLARFNTTIGDEKSVLSKHFFTGVPAPAGAILALLPMVVDFGVSDIFGFVARNHTLLINMYICIIALMLPSRFSTFSAKNFRISPKYLYLSMILAGIIIVYTFIYTWYVLTIIGILYLLSIPITEFWARKMLANKV